MSKIRVVAGNQFKVKLSATAKYWIPTEDEWFKAAYYDPTLNSGAGGYWLSASKAMSYPTSVTASATGDGSAGSSGNFANFNNAAIWNGVTGNVTTVGTNGGPSYYGTFDQNGNLYEWVDAAIGIKRQGGQYWASDVISRSYIPSNAPNSANAAAGVRIATKNNPLGLANFVAVGNINNAATTVDNATITSAVYSVGSVAYEYQIAKYELTVAEYVEFLNAVAKTDTYSLYIPDMGDVRGGVLRTGSSGNYTYEAKTDWANKPITYVSWFRAARYCNWLHNGKPTGAQNSSTTEAGAYLLYGATTGLILKEQFEVAGGVTPTPTPTSTPTPTATPTSTPTSTPTPTPTLTPTPIPAQLLFTWGGRSGNGTTTNVLTPTQISTDNWTSVTSGVTHNIAIRADGKLFAWGDNNYAQLGDGTTTQRLSLTQIGADNWTTAAAGYYHSIAINANGKLFAWGYNYFGQIGDNGGGFLAQPAFTPKQIGTSDWIYVAAGSNHSAAIRADGKLFTWGLNSSGQLGTGNTVQQNTPTQIGADNWTAVAGGNSHTVAIRSDGKLFAWGDNQYGGLGDGTTTQRNTPIQIGTDNWIAVAAGDRRTVAIRADGKLFAWGRNDYNQLGDGTTINRSLPTQIGTDTWTVVSTNFTSTSALNSAGKLFVWGGSSLGDGTTNQINTPTQIGTETWQRLAYQGGPVAALKFAV